MMPCLTHLRHLECGKACQVTSEKRLQLEGTSVTDIGMAALHDAHALTFLSVRRTEISQQAVAAFRAATPKVELIEPIEAATFHD